MTETLNVYFLHFECSPVHPSREVQIAYADVCCICSSQQIAEAWARDLILSHRFLPGELKAAVEIRPPQQPALDELEASLLAKAGQREPMCALQMTVAGDDRPDTLVRSLGIPDRGAKH